MNKQEIEILSQACRMAGIDSRKISPENPFSKSGKVAELLQAAVGELAPAQAAKWRIDAGGSLSVATLAEMQAGGELSEAAMADLWQHDAAFVADRQKESQQQEQSLLQKMEQQADEARLRNKTRELGNVDRAREALKAEAQRDAELQQQREASAQHAQQLNQRLEQQRQQARQMSGVVTNG